VCSRCPANLKPSLTEHHMGPGPQATDCNLGSHCFVLNTGPVTYIINATALTAIKLCIRNFCEELMVKTDKGVWVLVLACISLLQSTLLSSGFLFFPS